MDIVSNRSFVGPGTNSSLSTEQGRTQNANRKRTAESNLTKNLRMQVEDANEIYDEMNLRLKKTRIETKELTQNLRETEEKLRKTSEKLRETEVNLENARITIIKEEERNKNNRAVQQTLKDTYQSIVTSINRFSKVIKEVAGKVAADDLIALADVSRDAQGNPNGLAITNNTVELMSQSLTAIYDAFKENYVSLSGEMPQAVKKVLEPGLDQLKETFEWYGLTVKKLANSLDKCNQQHADDVKRIDQLNTEVEKIQLKDAEVLRQTKEEAQQQIQTHNATIEDLNISLFEQRNISTECEATTLNMLMEFRRIQDALKGWVVSMSNVMRIDMSGFGVATFPPQIDAHWLASALEDMIKIEKIYIWQRLLAKAPILNVDNLPPVARVSVNQAVAPSDIERQLGFAERSIPIGSLKPWINDNFQFL